MQQLEHAYATDAELYSEGQIWTGRQSWALSAQRTKQCMLVSIISDVHFSRYFCDSNLQCMTGEEPPIGHTIVNFSHQDWSRTQDKCRRSLQK